MIPQHIKEKIQQEAEARDYSPKSIGYSPFVKGAEYMYIAILSNPGEYGLAGAWRIPEEKMPPQNKRVLVEFKSGDCQMYELNVDANAIRAWWIRNVRRWLDESAGPNSFTEPKNKMNMQFKSTTVYTCKHIPSGEEWYLLGIRKSTNDVCVAGYPPTVARLSDCTDFEERLPLTEEELKYRNKQFGSNWD